MIALIGDKNISKGINGNTIGTEHFGFRCEASISTKSAGITNASDSYNFSCRCIYFMNTMIFLVCDIDVL
jgi:hypothetical protein